MTNSAMTPAWKIRLQLKTKTHRLSGVHSERPKTQQTRFRRLNLVLMPQNRVVFHESAALKKEKYASMACRAALAES
jgi:hypothetical protein